MLVLIVRERQYKWLKWGIAVNNYMHLDFSLVALEGHWRW